MPDYNTPNKRKRYIESEFRRLADIVEEMTGKGEATLVHGAFGVRRRNALLAVYDRVEAEFGKLCKGSLLETLLLAELLPLITYNSVNKYNDLTIGAALWILDTMNRTKRFREMTELLPDLTGEDPFYLPLDFNHPSYSNILIQSVMHVLFYKHTEKRKHRWNGEEYDIPTHLVSEETARGEKAEETFVKLMEMLPEEEVKRACERFKRLQWDLLSRYLKCDIWLTREIDRRTEMISLSDPLSGQVPGVLAGPMARIMADRKEDERRRLEEESDKLQRVKRGLPGRFTKYLRMGRKQIIRETGSRILADELSGFVIENPYEICFAIYALIESGEDLPWLMASGSQVCETALHLLPWFTEGTEDEWATALMYNVNGWLSDEPPEEEIDFYHTMHQDRTLAQIVYELSRGIVPIGQHPFEKNRLELIQEGMDERVARRVIDVAELFFLREFQSDAYKPFEWEEEAKDEEKDGVNGNPAMQQAVPDGSGGAKPGTADISAEAAKDESGEEENNSAEELEKAKQEIKALRAALYKERRTANENLAKAEQELKALRLEHRELADLRELVFNRESENPQRLEKTRRQISYPYQTKKRTVVFGGHDSFLRTIKPMLPTVRFVDAGNLAFSPDIIRNADVVWIQNNCISHSQYWIIVKNCKLAGVQMRYFGFASAEKCVEQLVDWDEK